MLPSDFLEEADLPHLPSEGLRLLAERIGVAATLRLWDMLRGRSINFPASFPKAMIAKWLRKNYDVSIAEAAWKLGVSKRTVSRIMNAVPGRKPEQQLSLF